MSIDAGHCLCPKHRNTYIYISSFIQILTGDQDDHQDRMKIITDEIAEWKRKTRKGKLEKNKSVHAGRHNNFFNA
jgi:hypothetical protein